VTSITDLIAYVISAVELALPAYTVQDGYVRPDIDLDIENLPLAMVFNPEVSLTRLKLGQLQEVTTLTIGLARKDGEGLQMRADVEAVQAQLDRAQDLNREWDSSLVTDRATDETNNQRTYGVLSFEATRVVVPEAAT